jgi:hypothetical protein
MKKIALRYGLFMFAGFTGFFLLMHLIGQSANTGLRMFNGVIHLSFIYMAIRAYRATYPDSAGNYMSGVATGMYASLFGVFGFVIFMLLFLVYNPSFLETIGESSSFGKVQEYLTPITASLFILTEGIAVSLIGSYIITRVVDMTLARTSH